jgi:hypothetical protein
VAEKWQTFGRKKAERLDFDMLLWYQRNIAIRVADHRRPFRFACTSLIKEGQIVIEVPKNFAGWISFKYRIIWSVNPYRKDKRTGVVRP